MPTDLPRKAVKVSVLLVQSKIDNLDNLTSQNIATQMHATGLTASITSTQLQVESDLFISNFTSSYMLLLSSRIYYL